MRVNCEIGCILWFVLFEVLMLVIYKLGKERGNKIGLNFV